MKPYLRGGGIAGAASKEESNQDPIYDLYAVSNHYGGSGFGHYTAYGLSPASREWYLFDDSSVSKVPKDQICSSAAYVLFYKLRGYHAGH
jgi:ubiquitin carboxyl-terminal hydrolase 4/11/15